MLFGVLINVMELIGTCPVELADVFEEVLEIVSYMTYFSLVISPNMWSLWALIMDAVQGWAINYFESECFRFGMFALMHFGFLPDMLQLMDGE